MSSHSALPQEESPGTTLKTVPGAVEPDSGDFENVDLSKNSENSSAPAVLQLAPLVDEHVKAREEKKEAEYDDDWYPREPYNCTPRWLCPAACTIM